MDAPGQVVPDVPGGQASRRSKAPGPLREPLSKKRSPVLDQSQLPIVLDLAGGMWLHRGRPYLQYSVLSLSSVRS